MEVGLLRVASRRDPAVPGMIMTGEMEDEVTNSSRDISMEKRIMFQYISIFNILPISQTIY